MVDEKYFYARIWEDPGSPHKLGNIVAVMVTKILLYSTIRHNAQIRNVVAQVPGGPFYHTRQARLFHRSGFTLKDSTNVICQRWSNAMLDTLHYTAKVIHLKPTGDRSIPWSLSLN